MSITAHNWVWTLTDVRLKSADRLVLLAYATHCPSAVKDPAEQYARPSVSTIADMCGLNRRQVQRVIRKLETLGLLEAVGRYPLHGGGHVVCYRLPVDKPVDGAAPAPHRGAARAPQRGAVPVVARGGLSGRNGAAPAPPESLYESLGIVTRARAHAREDDDTTRAQPDRVTEQMRQLTDHWRRKHGR